MLFMSISRMLSLASKMCSLLSVLTLRFPYQMLLRPKEMIPDYRE